VVGIATNVEIEPSLLLKQSNFDGEAEPVQTAQQPNASAVYSRSDTASESSAVELNREHSSRNGESSQPRSAKSRTGDSQRASAKAGAAKTVRSTDSAGGNTHILPEATIRATFAKLRVLSQAAIAGDTTAIDKIRIVLDSTPWVWQYAADLQIAVEERLVQLVAGDDVLKREAFRRRASELRSQLAEAGDSLLVRMAISRVVASWLFAQFLELRALSSADYRGAANAVLQAERRWQAAVRTLTMVRRAEWERQGTP
jgi:hypothetical protein